MTAGPRSLLIFLALPIVVLLAGNARGQSDEPMRTASPGLTCSPAPCLLTPTQASEGGGLATDTPIVTNPLNSKQLLLGSVDYNCSGEGSDVGFHLSGDGGSTWERVECMPAIVTKQRDFQPLDEPSVGYDRKGNAYIAGLYFDTEGDGGHGLVAVQKSTDGTHWSKPIVALRLPGQTYPFETSFAVDPNLESPRANSLYISGVMELAHGTQVLVSHSTDGGATWRQTAVDAVQKYPEEDDFTRMAVGEDGTVYAAWIHCRGKSGSGGALCPTVHIMFSKSTDGGNTWSPPQQVATVKMPQYWLLPITYERVYNYPAIAVDDSNGPYSGNLYVAMYTWTGAYLRAQVIRSTDGGETWSQPLPLAPKSDTHDQFFPAISVSSTGKVGVSWLDRRNDPNNIDYQAFAAISNDGGQSFGANWQLTTAFSNPETNGTENNWMGDYTGNTWAGDTFIAAWMDSSNGVDMQEVVGGIRLK
ncbi:MAG TPA: sialidase family protein [Terriglobales bacterium]|nr:sialidase family protein [Terriglobales bacterium]